MGGRLQGDLTPSPSGRWLQNGRPAEDLAGVQLASQGTVLHISRVEQAHSGLFACQATNEAGTSGAEVEVSVHGERVPGVGTLRQWAT